MLSRLPEGPAERAPSPPPLSPWEWAVLAGLLLYGITLRAWGLGSKPFRVDEAESGINALTVLQHGVPVDHYLGQPIFENILTRPWPESAEYEFKDSSYSERGLAVYHGWLPHYMTAASFALAGVKPDDDPTALRVRHSPQEMRRRTVAGRAPAVLFGAAFLAAAFFAARRLYGPDAAWAVLAVGAIFKPAVDFGRQARYYSPTLALAAGCALMIALMVQRGRWRDFLLGAVLFVLLFHTHVLSCFCACAAWALTAPVLARRPRGLAKLSAFAAVVALGALPWAVLTGFLGSASDYPKAFALLSFDDLWAFLKKLGPFPALAALTLVWLAAAAALRGRLPDRLVRPFADHRGAFLLLAAWAALGLAAFVRLVPAASYFHGRLVLTLMAPALLFGALLVAAAARAVSPRHAPVLAPALLVLALLPTGQVYFRPPSQAPGAPSVFDVVEHLRGLDLRPGTRVYATPNDHLTLTFYTGIPVQSVAPVRKSFLDRYEGELVILEAGPRYESLTGKEAQQALLAAGRPLPEDADRLARGLGTRLVREELRGRVARVLPGGPLPEHSEALFFALRLKTVQALAARLEEEGNPAFKGHLLRDHQDWWPVYYYRFVGPEGRMGRGLNYAGRTRDARAVVLPQQWVLYHCPARKGGGHAFRRAGPE
jgi:hypothetical protein